MYAIVKDSGQQFKVTEGQKIVIDERPVEVGATIEFPEVLLVAVGDDVRVGTPTVEGVKVTGEVIGHIKGDKIVVFKRKRRKSSRTKTGHRQKYVEVVIKEIKTN